MYGNWERSFVSDMMLNSGEEISMIPTEKANTLMHEPVQVEGDGSFLPVSEDDVIEVEHLFGEPKNEKVLVDNILSFNSDVPDVGHDHTQTENGTLDSNTTREVKEESNFEFLEGVLNGADGEGDLYIGDGLSTICGDYILNADFAEEVSELDIGSWGESCLVDAGLQRHSSGLRGRSTQIHELSELSTPTFSVPEPSSDPNSMSIDKMNIYKLHKTFSSTFGCETSVSDKEWLKHRFSRGLKKIVEFENGSNLLERGVGKNQDEGDMFSLCNNSSGRIQQCSMIAQGTKVRSLGRGVEREKFYTGVELVTNSHQSGKVGADLLDLGDREGLHLRRKRLRKPTRRYIEESSALKARYYTGKLETPTISSKNKVLHKSHGQHHRTGFGATSLLCRQDCLNGSAIQGPFGLHVHKGRLKRSKSIAGYDSENNKEDKDPDRNSHTELSAESQDEMSDECVTTNKTGKSGFRRKHHRLWTLSEVMKLIDGVSQYGVGRWTEIKRLLFSASAYRTSVDLKDKWRNLLRASGAQLHGNREVEQGRKNASQPIPQSVLQRVSELAIIYPYPRQRKSKLLCSTPITAKPESCTPVCRGGRNVLRKGLT